MMAMPPNDSLFWSDARRREYEDGIQPGVHTITGKVAPYPMRRPPPLAIMLAAREVEQPPAVNARVRRVYRTPKP
jgi:hypothetical protein